MTVPVRARIDRLRGILLDIAHVTAHGIGLFVTAGVARYLARTLERLFENRDVELRSQTQLALDLQELVRTHWWWLFPLILVADFAVMRRLRRRSPGGATAAGYSAGVLLLLLLTLGFTTVVLVHPFVVLVRNP